MVYAGIHRRTSKSSSSTNDIRRRFPMNEQNLVETYQDGKVVFDGKIIRL